MSFTIKLGTSTTIGGVTRYAFSVELPKVDSLTKIEKIKPASVVLAAKAKSSEK